MTSSIIQHPHGALSIPASGPEERRARARQDLARIAALDPEQPPLALAFLAGYYPAVFEAVLEAVGPCDSPEAEETPDQDPFCVKCGALVGVFLAHGREYRHYRGVRTATSKPRPYKTDHSPVVGWRPAAAAVAG
jgi:ribosomal protein S27AE